MDSIIKQRKLGFLEIVLETVKICGSRMREMALLAVGTLVAVLPVQLMLQKTWPARGTPIAVGRLAAWLALSLLESTILLLWLICITIITENAVEHRLSAGMEPVKQAALRLGRVITTNLLSGVIITGLSLLFIIPGILYGTYYIFAPYIAVLRGKYENEALAYSKSLVEGQWWRVFGILLGLSMISLAFSMPLYALVSKVSQSPYIGLIAQGLRIIPATVLGVAGVVLFLNNESTYRRRPAQKRQRAKLRARRPIKRAPSIQEYLDKKRGVSADKQTAASKTNAHLARTKAAKKTTAAKKTARTTQRKATASQARRDR